MDSVDDAACDCISGVSDVGALSCTEGTIGALDMSFEGTMGGIDDIVWPHPESNKQRIRNTENIFFITYVPFPFTFLIYPASLVFYHSNIYPLPFQLLETKIERIFLQPILVLLS